MVCKCKNCGIEYWDSLSECPYCGLPALKHPQLVKSVHSENAYERVMKHKNQEYDVIK